MSAPICRTAEEAYQAGLRDAASEPKGGPELAERIATTFLPAGLPPWPSGA
jgi:hypothetical protein